MLYRRPFLSHQLFNDFLFYRLLLDQSLQWLTSALTLPPFMAAALLNQQYPYLRLLYQRFLYCRQLHAKHQRELCLYSGIILLTMRFPWWPLLVWSPRLSLTKHHKALGCQATLQPKWLSPTLVNRFLSKWMALLHFQLIVASVMIKWMLARPALKVTIWSINFHLFLNCFWHCADVSRKQDDPLNEVGSQFKTVNVEDDESEEISSSTRPMNASSRIVMKIVKKPTVLNPVRFKSRKSWTSRSYLEIVRSSHL